MKFKLSVLAAAAALFLGVAGPASAWTPLKTIQTIGHWKIEANELLCQADGKFANGTTLSFAMNAKGAWLVNVLDPRWSINKGDDYKVVMQVDQGPAATFTAWAQDTYVGWEIPETEATFNLLAYGRTLKAQIGSVVVSYDLAHSEAVLKSLARCIGPRMAAANPFAGSSPSAPAETPASTETPSNPFRRL
jgi:hypothetical protein